jgi:UDP-N-acetylmuramoyl-L-alanyl-D-glutamate--2,6-diaminopimelate ligase
VTDDNPRHENPDSIRAQILKAVPSAQEIGDRTKAIQSAVKELQDGDVLVVAGKGHETGQIVGEVVHDFDDVEEVKKAIDKITVKKA